MVGCRNWKLKPYYCRLKRVYLIVEEINFWKKWWKCSGGFCTNRLVHSRLDARLKGRIFLIFLDLALYPIPRHFIWPVFSGLNVWTLMYWEKSLLSTSASVLLLIQLILLVVPKHRADGANWLAVSKIYSTGWILNWHLTFLKWNLERCGFFSVT